MQTSHFQLGLIATLAVGLGFSLASAQAVGYPAGAAVSYGSNPVQSFGGTINAGDTVALETLPTDQDFIVTDISLVARSDDNDCADRVQVQVTSGGETVASYLVTTFYGSGSNVLEQADSAIQSMTSGLKIAAGATLNLQTSRVSSFTYYGCWSGRTTDVEYTLSGYYSQP